MSTQKVASPVMRGTEGRRSRMGVCPSLLSRSLSLGTFRATVTTPMLSTKLSISLPRLPMLTAYLEEGREGDGAWRRQW